MFRTLVFIAVVLLSSSAGARAAHAEEFSPKVDAEYFWDGGVVPFMYFPAAVAAGLVLFGEPSDTPRLFPVSEGGQAASGDTVPEPAVAAYCLGFAGIIAAMPKSERWHHLKGFGQAMATTAALTEVAKNIVGRQRPHFQEGMDDEFDLRRSFFSGHASFTAAGTVYMGLYLSRNVLPNPSIVKTASMIVLGGLLVSVPYSRLVDDRHHLSDIVTGAVVGSTLATVFYVYQEGRFRDEREAFREKKRNQIQIVPNLRNPGASLLMRW